MAVGAVNEFGQETFLLLLTTQLRFQNPLDPIDNTEFISQLTQFSQLEETINLGNTLDVAVQYMSSLNNYGAAGLIGKQVRVEGQTLQVNQGVISNMVYQLNEDATEVSIQIYNSDGDLVRGIKEGGQSAGSYSIQWDGLDVDNLPVPDGYYVFQVAAVNQAGLPIGFQTFVTGMVEGVRYEEGVAYLSVNGNEIPAAGIVEIYQ